MHVRHGSSAPDASVVMSLPPHSDTVGKGHASSVPERYRLRRAHTPPGTRMGAAFECRSMEDNLVSGATLNGMLPVKEFS